MRELSSKRAANPAAWQPSAESAEVLATCAVVADSPASEIQSYVISMARQASDVLAVKLLLKESGVNRAVPVSPLFETLMTLLSSAYY